MSPTKIRAGVAIPRGIAAGFFVSALLSGCRCEDRLPPSGLAPVHEAVSPPLASHDQPVLAPALELTAAPIPADGVEVPLTLVRQLASPNAESRPQRAARDPAEDCARGCALLDAHDQLVIVRPRYEDESGVPASIDIFRFARGELRRESLAVGTVSDDALEAFQADEGDAPWAARVRRALGAGPYRRAEGLVAARARTFFSLEEYAPLVALRPPLADRWLFAEQGETSYRIHLLRVDRSVDRVLATLPLVVAACDGDYAERACVAPLAIDEIIASADGRALVALVHHPAAGDGVGPSDALVLPLDDASALPPAYNEVIRASELERSLRASGPRTTPFAADEPVGDGRGARCMMRGCALYRENGDVWVVRPARIEHGSPQAPILFAPGAEGLPILGTERIAAEAQGALVERALETAPRREGRPLVARQGIAGEHGIAAAALVELRPPHAAARISVERDGDAYVLRWHASATSTEIARVPALRLGDDFAAPSLLEVFAPPEGGFPLVVIGAAATRAPSAPEGVAHTTFHVVITALPDA